VYPDDACAPASHGGPRTRGEHVLASVSIVAAMIAFSSLAPPCVEKGTLASAGTK
jgi:hypothetical protein